MQHFVIYVSPSFEKISNNSTIHKKLYAYGFSFWVTYKDGKLNSFCFHHPKMFSNGIQQNYILDLLFTLI